jgi:three-Cys-motif partner protein
MATPKTTRWPIQPHTLIKHLLLRRYLNAWLPIMATYTGRMTFIDGFAGPGRYSGGEDGSPIIALKALLDHPHFKTPRPHREIVFLFIEEDIARANALTAEIAELRAGRTVPDWVKVHVEHGAFATVMQNLLDKLETGSRRLAPTFLFVDPFGFGGVPMRLIGRILNNPSCECLVTFMYEPVNRFLGHPDEAVQANFDELFGTTEWRTLVDEMNPVQRRMKTVTLYRKQLMDVAQVPYVRAFEMINEGNRTEYFLYFGTKNLKGFSKMKESMWRADPVQGRVFSDLTDTRQEVLLKPEADLLALRRSLQDRFRGRGWISIDQVEQFVLTETPYSEAIHLKRRTLAPMEAERLVVASRMDGKKRRPGSFPPGTLLRFP